MLKERLKAISLISGVIFLAFSITAVFIIYEAGRPVIERMQTSTAVERMRTLFTDLDKVIQEVAAEGKGSKRTAYIRMDLGTLTINGTEDTVAWEIDSKQAIFSPRTSQQFGNIVIGSNLETKTYESTCVGTDAYILENEYLKVCIKKIGSASNYTSYNTSQLLLGIYQKDLAQWLDLKSLEISVDDETSSETGIGYTKLEKTSSNLPYGEATAYLQSDYGVNYYIHFILESGADFLTIRANL